MGVTIHYRGKLDDVDRVEDFEDRVLDCALELGASARIWRSASDKSPDRFVRGLILDLAPGQESTSLLISPAGWLVNLFDIKAAENGTLPEPSWCFVKTQFGPVQGHVALVELLRAIQREFMTNLEVHDEGGYWDNRDVGELAGKIQFLSSAINTLATELNHYSLSDEAAEDPGILLARVERVAKLVQRTIGRPAEHPPVQFDEAEDWAWSEASEAKWDPSYREQRRKQERLHRAIEERLAAGENHTDAFENAMRDEGFIDLPGEEEREDWSDELVETDGQQEDESWRASLPDAVLDGDEDQDDDEDELALYSRNEHPLLKRAMDLMARLHGLVKDMGENASQQVQVLLGGAGDMMGGLAQAVGRDGDDDEFSIDPFHRGLAIVQLKRALRGAAFAAGSLFALAQEGILDDRQFKELRTTIETLRDDIYSQLQQFRKGEFE